MKTHALIINLYKYLKGNIIWAASTYAMFWCSIIPVAYSFYIINNSNYNEFIIRIYGLIFQLGGVGTVAFGIHKTRILFGLPKTLEFLKHSLKSRPIYKKEGKPYLKTHDLVAQGIVVRPILGKPELKVNPSIEDRVKFLENHISLLDKHIKEINKEMNYRTEKYLKDIFNERTERKSEYMELKKILEKAEIGGLHISTMGIIWLIIGTIFCAIPHELSRWLS